MTSVLEVRRCSEDLGDKNTVGVSVVEIQVRQVGRLR